MLLNDPSFVEAARGLATRTLTANKADDADRLAWAWREVTSRTAKPDELTELATLLAAQRERYAHDTTAAEQLISIGQSKIARRCFTRRTRRVDNGLPGHFEHPRVFIKELEFNRERREKEKEGKRTRMRRISANKTRFRWNT